MSRQLEYGEKRSAGSLARQRVKLPWPKDRDFRILSIDGGGIKGIFPSAVLAELECRLSRGEGVTDYFDLIAGTSTGGIIALGLGAGKSPRQLLDLYIEQGKKVFPPSSSCCLARFFRSLHQIARYRYNNAALKKLLLTAFGNDLLGSSKSRLCIPAFEAKHSEVCVYKTPHHPDYKTDLHIPMVDIALATSAAPSYFKPYESNGYTLVDGGVWANNPTMIAVLEALTAFDISPQQIKVLTIGCGDQPFKVGYMQKKLGGLFFWRKIIEAAIRLQSLNATNQSRLLLSPANVIRLEPGLDHPIELDDWKGAKELLPDAATKVIGNRFDEIKLMFLSTSVEKYVSYGADIN